MKKEEAPRHEKSKGSNSLNEGIRKHEPVPTPSMKEINAAMDNLYAFTNTDGDGEEKIPKELIPALPTMADDASNLHLKLANPFGGGTLSSTPEHPVPRKLHLQEGASELNPDDTQTVFAPRQIIGDDLGDDTKHDDLDEFTEDTASPHHRNESTERGQRLRVGFNMDLNTNADAKDVTESDTEIGAPDPKQMLALQYDDTTLNEESTDDEAEVKPTPHSSLFREQSNWKWQQNEVSNLEREMARHHEELKAQAEEADLKATITYYRQRTGDEMV